jgi:photosystem II stability/assembly factor-like uncharacterized protein
MVIAVGGGTTVVGTYDGGNAWRVNTHVGGLNTSLADVFFVDDTHGWAVGYDGTILRTQDGGSTWTTLRNGTGEYLYSVYFLDKNTGWVCGQKNPPGVEVLLKTTDGGNHWYPRSTGSGAISLSAVCFVNADSGWIVGDDKILRTVDGGTNWVSTDFPHFLNDVSFTDSKHGWIAGDGGILLATNDGGLNWVLQATGGGGLYGIHFTDENHGWVVGESGSIMATTNGGATWLLQYSTTSARLNDVQFIDINTGWAVGTGGTLLRTTDGGINWISKSEGTSFSLMDIAFSGATTGWAVGGEFYASGPYRGIIMKTTNGGDPWYPVASPSITFQTVTFADSLNGWAGGNYGHITHTTDGGITWNDQASGSLYTILSIENLHSDSVLIAVGGGQYDRASMAAERTPEALSHSICIKTKDAGASWVPIPMGLDDTYQALSFVDEQTGWLVGNDYQGGLSHILKSTDAGTTWNLQLTIPGLHTYGVKFVNAQTGWIVGGVSGSPGSGFVRKTTNGGATWTTQLSYLPQSVISVDFIDVNTGCIGLRDGSAYRSSDGGNQWFLQASPTSNAIRSMVMVDAATVYASGDGGTILKSPGELPPDLPQAPHIVYPENGAVLNSAVVPFDWKRSAGAHSFRLELSREAGFGHLLDIDSALTETYQTVVLPSDSLSFYWRVRAENALGVSDWSEPGSFNLHIIPPKDSIFTVMSGWNMISIPSTLADYATKNVYPTAISKAFRFDKVYIPMDTLRNGVGYWIKFGGVQTVSITYNPRSSDTVEVSRGWNIIGSVSHPLSVSDIVSIPGSMVTSKFFGYHGTYTKTDTVFPAEAYWVKVDQDGKLVLSDRYASSVSGRIRINPTDENPPPPPDHPPTETKEVPDHFGLYQNYPNPFNPATRFEYDLPSDVHVSIRVFNTLGQEIAILVNEFQASGRHEAVLDASALPSGIYFYRLDAGTYVDVKKMVLLR